MFGILIILIIGSLNSFFFAKDNNYNKYVSVPSYKGLIISCLNILTWCGIPIPI